MELVSCCGWSGIVGRTMPLGRLVTGGTIGRGGIAGGGFVSTFVWSTLPAGASLSLAIVADNLGAKDASEGWFKMTFL